MRKGTACHARAALLGDVLRGRGEIAEAWLRRAAESGDLDAATSYGVASRLRSGPMRGEPE